MVRLTYLPVLRLEVDHGGTGLFTEVSNGRLIVPDVIHGKSFDRYSGLIG